MSHFSKWTANRLRGTTCCLVQAAEQSKEVQQELQSVKDRAEKQEAAMTALEESLSASSKV